MRSRIKTVPEFVAKIIPFWPSNCKDSRVKKQHA